MRKRSVWSLKISTAAIVLIPAAIGINYLGKLIAGLLKLPLWLDSIGTVLAGMLAGPIIGALSGIMNNIIYGMTVDPISTVYAITSGVIGMGVGIMAYKGWIANIKKAIVIGVVVGFAAAIVSTPLNIIFWGGQTGNVWGDAFYAYFISMDLPVWLASFGDSIVVDVPDKVATVIISYLIFKGLPNTLTNIYRSDNEIEEL
ncbi:energy-coupling factor transport system substrate-specific component [Lentibacillus halodurans]|uniref:Energy-coupling factor transport system substrate-specific component n=1 Tax=Lentibacillus halodurans TaxID=237679 RepID=A0A1I0YHJ2_9BACI|nr:ECF transporter S component [Lentibacillus halodurans]SFB12681.1 energy-coupling factor transport system substrate-specific component [Lentibacillus halodurans]